MFWHYEFDSGNIEATLNTRHVSTFTPTLVVGRGSRILILYIKVLQFKTLKLTTASNRHILFFFHFSLMLTGSKFRGLHPTAASALKRDRTYVFLAAPVFNLPSTFKHESKPTRGASTHPHYSTQVRTHRGSLREISAYNGQGLQASSLPVGFCQQTLRLTPRTCALLLCCKC